jgi:hypothetical protein
MKRIVASLLLGLLAGSSTGAQQASIDYRLDEVRRTVTVTHNGRIRGNSRRAATPSRRDGFRTR